MATTILKQNFASSYYNYVSMGKLRGKIYLSRTKQDEFLQIYQKDIVKHKFKYGLAEKPQKYRMIVADIDLKKKDSEPKKLYSNKQVKQVVEIYQTVLSELVENIKEENLTCVLLEKDFQIAGEYVKNGFHLQFPNCFVNTEISQVLGEKVDALLSENNVFPEFPNANDKNAMIVNWLTYGSVKEEGLSPYLVSKVFDYDCNEIVLETAFSDYKIYDCKEKLIPMKTRDDIIFNFPRILSINPNGREYLEIKQVEKDMIKQPVKERKDYPKLSDEDALKIATRLVNLLSPSRADDYKEWLTIGFVLYSITSGSAEGLDLWDSFSQTCGDKYSEGVCALKWANMVSGNYTIGTLHHYAKIDDPIGYSKLFKTENPEGEDIDLSDVGLANYFYSKVNIKYHSIRKQMFVFNKETKLWELHEKESLRASMVDVIFPYIDNACKAMSNKSETVEKYFQDALRAIKTTKKQSAILTSLWAKIIVNRDDKFIDISFNKRLGLFPISDGKVIDLRTLEVRDRKQDDYFTQTTDNKFLSETECDIPFVKKYFSDILTTKRDEYIDWLGYVIGYALSGENNMKQFYIWLGEKDTGKSLFIQLLNWILGDFAGVANDKVFKKSKSESVHDTEVFSLTDKRFAFVSELDEKESFNEQLMKKITGDDEISIRGCGSNTNNTVQINCLLGLATNEIPTFKEPAFIQRMRIISFHTKFPIDATIKDTLEAKTNDFFTFACLYAKKFYDNGRKFDDVKEVLESTRTVVDSRDSVKLWFDEDSFIINQSFVKKKDSELPEMIDTEPRAKKTEVYSEYINWCCYQKISGVGRTAFYKNVKDMYGFDECYGGKVWRGIVRKEF